MIERKIFEDEELANIFNIKEQLNKKLKNRIFALEDLEKEYKNFFPNFSFSDNTIENEIIAKVMECNGNIKNNPKSLICPKCHSKYIILYQDGDVYYRLLHGDEQTIKKLNNMQLFINRASVCGIYDTLYFCLGCGHEW